MAKKEDLLTFFKKNYVLVTIVYLSINIYFHQYIPICIYLIFFQITLELKNIGRINVKMMLI